MSEAAIWELTTKIHKGKLTMFGDSVQLVLDEIAAQHKRFYQSNQRISCGRVFAASSSRSFDRMLIAQAIEEKVSLIASDEMMREYEVEVVWD